MFKNECNLQNVLNIYAAVVIRQQGMWEAGTNNKIRAIKVLRAGTSYGLRDAVDVMDKITEQADPLTLTRSICYDLWEQDEVDEFFNPSPAPQPVSEQPIPRPGEQAITDLLLLLAEATGKVCAMREQQPPTWANEYGHTLNGSDHCQVCGCEQYEGNWYDGCPERW